MKVTKDYLSEGDSVEVSVTHMIRIDGEESWVRYGVVTKVQPGESAEKTRQRASEGVNRGVLDTIQETVETVRKASA
jgi:hypothetical protein